MLKQSKRGFDHEVDRGLATGPTCRGEQAAAPERQHVPASHQLEQQPGCSPGLRGLAAAFSAPHSVCRNDSVAGACMMHLCQEKQAGVALGLKQAEGTCSSNDRMMQ